MVPSTVILVPLAEYNCIFWLLVSVIIVNLVQLSYWLKKLLNQNLLLFFPGSFTKFYSDIISIIWMYFWYLIRAALPSLIDRHCPCIAACAAALHTLRKCPFLEHNLQFLFTAGHKLKLFIVSLSAAFRALRLCLCHYLHLIWLSTVKIGWRQNIIDSPCSFSASRTLPWRNASNMNTFVSNVMISTSYCRMTSQGS